MDESLSAVVEEGTAKPWQLLASLACSLLIVLGGMFWTYGIWRETNDKYHRLYHVNETVTGLRSALGLREASNQ